ncbi:AsmA family protein [Ideonella sp. DXS29W]|uniref:AsmA family protein n=1 Tax=Ideonella lacteola TaxID=2984193 RepID=A0ABU9BXI0_9BURK
MLTRPNLARRPTVLWSMAGVLAAVTVALGVAEWQGWRFLARPAERWLSQHLEREVRFGAAESTGFRLSLWRGIRLQVADLSIANPPWSQLGPMLTAHQAELRLRYRDLWAARGGCALNVQALQADTLQLRLERRQDGRASWQFGGADSGLAAAEPAINGVHFESLMVRDGRLHWIDEPSQVTLDGEFAYRPDAWRQTPGWVAQAKGRYRDAPMAWQARTAAVLPGIDALAPAEVPLSVEGSAGRARLKFEGSIRDLFGEQSLNGRYALSGPSLAAVGDPLGVTLPTTAEFTLRGQLQRDGDRWRTQVESAQIGRSRLSGDFEFHHVAGQVPSLTGELRGTALWLQDLGPAIGVEPGTGLAGQPERPTSSTAARRVLPDRPLDLPSLAAMKADVRVRLDRFELGHPKLESIRPLKARITLGDSVLTVKDLDATLAQGRIWGGFQLDARQPRDGIWDVNLSTQGLRLEQWIDQARPAGQPPYVAGDIGGQLQLRGHGRSVAELLAHADGQAKLWWTEGQISHLVVEGSGIDLAQALGVMVTGDRALPVQCGAADLRIRQGIVSPQVMVVDTSDSTLWATGHISLASEELSLTGHVAPKDVSPLALRTPVRVRGTLADPDLSLAKGPLVRRAVPALLLGMLNPLAALLPLIDLGSGEARDRLNGCRTLAARQPAPAPSRARSARPGAS